LLINQNMRVEPETQPPTFKVIQDWQVYFYE
jgi:hypothetical protein